MSTLEDVLTVDDPNAKNDPRFKLGLWDGGKSLLDGEGRFLTGLLKFVRVKLRENDIDPELVYEDDVGPSKDLPEVDPDVVDGKTLRDYQVDAVKKALFWKRGVIQIPTGGGKTELAIALAKHINQPTVFVVNASNLLVQTAKRFKSGGVSSLGIIGDVRDKEGKALKEQGVTFWGIDDTDEVMDCQVVVAMVQSMWALMKRQDQDIFDFLESRKVIIGDEIHHAGSMSWTAVFSRCPAAYRYGLSATPWVSFQAEENVRDLILIGLTGETIFSLSINYLMSRGFLSIPRVFMVPVMRPKVTGVWDDWHPIYNKGIVRNGKRNEMIVTYATSFYRKGDKVLVLISQKNHGYKLVRMFRDAGVHAYFSHGNRKVIEWDKDYENDDGSLGALVYSDLTPEDVHDLVASSGEDGFVLIGTSTYDQSLDLPELNALIVGAGGKKLRQTLQRPGRILRPGPEGKVTILDFNDMTHGVLKKHSYMRREIYEEVGWEVTNGAPSFQMPIPA